jgi:hypothetical protein
MKTLQRKTIMLKKSTALSKITAALAAIGIVATFVTAPTAFAAEISKTPETTEYYAHLDLASASDDLKPVILDARNEIIYHSSWTVNGAAELVLPDGSVEKLPEFSDLFPGWDVPKSSEPVKSEAPAPTLVGTDYFPTHWTTISAPPTSNDTPPFVTFTSNGATFDSYASQIPGSTYNLGVRNTTTGKDLAFTYGPVGTTIRTYPVSGNSYAVRTSTYSTTGSAYMYVITI